MLLRSLRRGAQMVARRSRGPAHRWLSAPQASLWSRPAAFSSWANWGSRSFNTASPAVESKQPVDSVVSEQVFESSVLPDGSDVTELRVREVKPNNRRDSKRARGWKSKAVRTHITATLRQQQISPRKLNDIVRPMRGLSVREAMIQLRLSERPKARWVRRLLQKVADSAVNNFNMNRYRLVLTEAYVGKGYYGKRLRWRARGRADFQNRYRANLTIRVEEIPPPPRDEMPERRLGRWGPTHSARGRINRAIRLQKNRKRAAIRRGHLPRDPRPREGVVNNDPPEWNEARAYAKLARVAKLRRASRKLNAKIARTKRLINRQRRKRAFEKFLKARRQRLLAQKDKRMEAKRTMGAAAPAAPVDAGSVYPELTEEQRAEAQREFDQAFPEEEASD